MDCLPHFRARNGFDVGRCYPAAARYEYHLEGLKQTVAKADNYTAPMSAMSELAEAPAAMAVAAA